ncbi:hypothetical protein PICMEDRAFT_15186 [Pichia membranifaciens NRRL Y-2026]|uniref:Maintenance of telomere capping protein 6 n=1 Tax=Pichia membranifaciens NRRL Y-2026 TaxID=763406 RepID=A0A1E3NM73_9ASCO|nr:hypothetical protein PICMEDRAFT_15186 [Pichia membranifaciens NRRL Y-2026]ODQ47201.1 hypothetical protein PICMEDRAFT_15186 [Pichia membranifaciens NRRL Y-2026]
MIILSTLKVLFLLLFHSFLAEAIDFSDKETAAESWDILAAYSQASEWPNLSRDRAIGIRAQRDVSANVTIDYIVTPGVDLSRVVFEPYGYNAGSLQYLKTLMNVGVQTFVLDLYYDETNRNWLLCPKSRLLNDTASSDISECSISTFNLTSLITTMNQFLSVTNNDLDINVMFLLVRLNSLSSTGLSFKANVTDSNITSLSTAFSGINKIVSPSSIDGNALPTLNNLLFKLSQRVFPVIIENNLPTNSTYDLSVDKTTFFTFARSSAFEQPVPGYPTLNLELQNSGNMKCQQIDLPANSSSSLRFSYDTRSSPFTIQSYWESVQCGYSPIISHSLEDISNISTFLEVSSWAWAPFQPTVTNLDELNIPNLFSNLTNRDLPAAFTTSNYTSTALQKSPEIITADNNNNTIISGNNEISDDNPDDEYVNRCAAISKIGWIATTCDRKLFAICVNIKNSSDYAITVEKKSYMKADIECKALDGDYQLALPRNTIEQNYMISLIPLHEDTIWIDLNSLSSENCWVVGVNSNCPYQLVVSNHIFVRMITPSTVMALLLFLLLFVLQFQRIPVHKNRKYWRKLLNEKLKNDYDGVPS